MQASNYGTLEANRVLTENEVNLVNRIAGTTVVGENRKNLWFFDYKEDDMEELIQAIILLFAGNDVTLSGSINHYSGYGSVGSVLYVDETGCRTEERNTPTEMSDIGLIDAYTKRFGTLYVALVGGVFVRGTQTLDNSGCRDMDEAVRNARDDDRFVKNDDVNIFVGTFMAKSREDALMMAEAEFPEYKHLMTIWPVHTVYSLIEKEKK